MIPENIIRKHMLEVIGEIQASRLAVPPRQRSTRYCLVYEGQHYPPKYIVRKANIAPNGEELLTHYGGQETNRFCESRRFIIVEHGGAPH